MTPDERDRLTRLEVEVEQLTDRLKNMDGKLDQLVTAASMGKGAWWIIIKLGGVLAFISYVVIQVYDRVTN